MTWRLPKHVQEAAPLVAELIGTYMLVFTIGCNILAKTSIVWAATSTSLMYMAFLYCFSSVSGGHLNPAVSLACGLVGKLPWKAVLLYCIVQILGGLLAGLSFCELFGASADLVPKAGFGLAECFLVETLFTTMLVFVVLNCACCKKNHPPQAPNQFYPLAAGFALLAGGYAAGPISGATFNPAVAFAIDATSVMGFGVCLWYLLFQVLGALLAVLLFRQVRPEERFHNERDIAHYEPKLPTKLASEFIGTLLLVLTVGLNVTGKSGATAWSAAAALTSMVYSLGDVSGGHFNPAVTLAVVLSGRGQCPPNRGVCYILIQVLAGLIAAFLYAGINHTNNLFYVQSYKYGMVAAVEMEFVFTFVIALVVLSTATVRGITTHGRNFYFGLAIGSCVMAGGIASGPVSGGYLNPAVTFGASTASTLNGGSFVDAWKYMLAEFLGGAAAAGVFHVTHAREYPKTRWH
mmetsp:Transcript_115496/g.204065  ORF Transcript_115496/g.204065 Transcript_115496/m.204065 type:complete len:463 (+) Transcript_115496:135-1523(+)